MPDGRHSADQDTVNLRFAERRKESAERAAWRLRRHLSSGDLAKNRACCHSSLSSNPRAPRNRRKMRWTRASSAALAVKRFTFCKFDKLNDEKQCQKNSLGRFKGWDEPRSLLANFVPSAVKKICWFVSVREMRVSFGSGYARLGLRIWSATKRSKCGLLAWVDLDELCTSSRPDVSIRGDWD